ncbi:MAG: glutamate racemase [Flavobacteriales bacterium]|nr:glutamate racemase [Flavobacteriales bacterium]|tara:strand:+ start:357 stop:1130 length:774 start_codon:yes stop_codon:yes gene_type:complete
MKGVQKIGLFDSGLGGLTVLSALNKVLPGVPKVYYGDTLHLPYGDKSDRAIQGYSIKIVQFLKDQGCDLIVIACNSASASAGKELESRFPELTFINVIDPVVDYLAQLGINRVGLLGTRATVRSEAYSLKLAQKNSEVALYALATPLLVPLIEDGFLGTGIDSDVLAHYLNDSTLDGIQALVPGCTHYPLLKKTATAILKEVLWIDAPNIVAEEVAKHWNSNEIAEDTFYLSDRTDNFLTMAKKTFQIDAYWELVRL